MSASRFIAVFFAGLLAVSAQDLKDFTGRVTEFTLENGLHFIVMERHELPVISFHTYVNAGYSYDPAGENGLAHLLEHVTFKGTETIGTRNWSDEKKALDDLEAANANYEAERNKGPRSNAGKLASLESGLKVFSNTAVAQSEPGEFMRVLQENGGAGIVSRTSPDAAETAYSFPSNRAELWFLMESQRLSHPVFREAYRERDVMVGELQNQVEMNPRAKLLQMLLSTAFSFHPYRNPEMGWIGDVVTLRRSQLQDFFETYYAPGNMAIGIVGDIDPAEARRLAERYFGPIAARPIPRVLSPEPPQPGPKTVALIANVPPMMVVGYKRPEQTHRDDVAFDLIRALLVDGQSALLRKELVDKKNLAQSAEVTATYPSGRYPNLFTIMVTLAANHTVEEVQAAIDTVLGRLQTAPMPEADVQRVKYSLRTHVMQVLASNQQMAALLPNYYFNYGDWRRLFATLTEMDRLTGEDLQRVAVQYFTPSNRTIAFIANGAQQFAARGAK